jgi:hypothetical protein
VSRAEELENDRVTIAALQTKYGLKLCDSKGVSLATIAEGPRLSRKILMPSRIVIPCKAVVKDNSTFDPCLIVPFSIPLELLPRHRALAVGGQISAITRSDYALSEYLMNQSWKAQGFWEGRALPLLVSIHGEYRYLLPHKSYFFRCGAYKACDLDQVSPMEPTARDLKLDRYLWGSDLTDELTVVVAEY